MSQFGTTYTVTDTHTADLMLRDISIVMILGGAYWVIQLFRHDFVDLSSLPVLEIGIKLIVLGSVLYFRQSRLVALLLLLFTLSTILNLYAAGAYNTHTGIMSNTNVIWAHVFIIICNYFVLQGAFGYHKYAETEINVKNIVILTLVILAYTVVLSFGIIIGYIFLSGTQNVEATIEEIRPYVTLFEMYPFYICLLLGSLGFLPGTRKRKALKEDVED